MQNIEENNILDEVQTDWITYGPYDFLEKAPLTQSNLFLEFEKPFAPEVGELIDSVLTEKQMKVNDLIEYQVQALNSNPATEAKKVGKRYENEYSAVLIRSKQILVSHKNPYKGWEGLFDDFMALIDKINSSEGPNIAKRASGRFINHFKIGSNFEPGTKAVLNQYFNFYPVFKDKFIDGVEAYQLNYLVSLSDMKANVKFKLDPTPEFTAILFDIEVFKNLDDVISKKETLEDIFNGIRNTKNFIFHNSLTEELKEQFK